VHALPLSSAPPAAELCTLLLDALAPHLGLLAPGGILALLRSLHQAQAPVAEGRLALLAEAAAGALERGCVGSSSSGDDGSGSGLGSGCSSSDIIEVLWLLSKLGHWTATADGSGSPSSGRATEEGAAAARAPPSAALRLFASAEAALVAEMRPGALPVDPVAIPRLLRLCAGLRLELSLPARTAALLAAQQALPDMRGESIVLLLRGLAALQPSPAPQLLVRLAVKELSGRKGRDVLRWQWVDEVAAYCQGLGVDLAALRQQQQQQQQQQQPQS
jgi:hypothetical protein